MNAVSGLTFATPIVRLFGFKNAMILSLWGYTAQIVSLYVAVILRHQGGNESNILSWVIAITGSVIAGFTSAVWWTAQGVYFEKTSSRIATSIQSYMKPETMKKR